ncbi:chalcone isomerase family protein [Thalassolituus sp. LLYu03]|uniref:chalcone isomerase family protein n=1 Tax=Thalassolituus sp. LLYu03 TaxID=3421656 RepID=UPI003D2C7224
MIRPALIALALLPLAFSAANARTIAGYTFPEVLPQTAEHNEARLNGAAVRTMYYLVDAYVGLMYVEQPGHDAEALIQDDGYKRVVYHILVDRVSGRRIATAMYDSMQLNLSEAEAAALNDRLQTLVKMFDSKMEKGDVGYVEYLPGIGSRVVIRGEEKGIIPGKDLFDALMRIWIGEHPVTQAFKEGVLGLDDNALKVSAE